MQRNCLRRAAKICRCSQHTGTGVLGTEALQTANILQEAGVDVVALGPLPIGRDGRLASFNR